MDFEKVVGLPHIKNHLRVSAEEGRVAHAQLFAGPCGSGVLPMALAYARLLLCGPGNDTPSHRLFDGGQHPDLHFVFPVNTNDQVKSSHPVSDLFLGDWRTFLNEQPYGNLFDWYQHLGIDNKQGNISVHEAQDIYKKMSLKSFEGGKKIMLIWMAHRMNTQTANKLLKLIEEPTKGSIFLLITDQKDQILQTIFSRCQLLEFPPLAQNDVASALEAQHGLSPELAQQAAHKAHGDYRKALSLLKEDPNEAQFEAWFIQWVRAAFRAKGNKAIINELFTWSETVASQNRETLKQFLNYCVQFFRQALLMNYQSEGLVYLTPKTKNFQLAKFAPYVHGNNIEPIFEALETALYHIERNGNPKIVLSDLSIQLTRLLHAKPN